MLQLCYEVIITILIIFVNTHSDVFLIFSTAIFSSCFFGYRREKSLLHTKAFSQKFLLTKKLPRLLFIFLNFQLQRL